MLFPPEPNYDYEVSRLVKYYENAVQDIRVELNQLDLSGYQRAHTRATLNNVKAILKELNKSSLSWLERYIPQAISDGITRALISLGLAVNFTEAKVIMKFNHLNQELIKTIVADTQSDLLAVTQNVDRKVRIAVRQVTAEVLRSNVTKGVNATNTLRSDIVAGLRKTLGDSVNTGIIDAVGRRWRPTKYVDVLVRTKMMEAHKEATINEAVSREAYYGVISRHGAKDACRNYEGRIVKLERNADGTFPYIGDLPRSEIFHPRCRHLVSPFKRIDRLPDDVKRVNNL